MTIPKRSNEEIVEEFRKKQTLIEPSGFLADVGEDYEAVDFNTEVMEDWLRTILTEKDAEVEKVRTSIYTSLVAAVEGLREKDLPSSVHDPAGFCKGIGNNQACSSFLTTINSIFKE